MATPSSGRALSITPGARVLKSPLSDETIWRKLKEAGFDEESIKRRDKAALIAYIAKLETEIFDLQHHMGLLILDKKDLDLKFEQIKASAEAAELMHKRECASHVSALAEASKREESLKKALSVEKECIASIDKALHEMRAESAETKVAAEAKLVQARTMMEEAQIKTGDADAKFCAAEALQAEASRYRRSAERVLQEVESREEDLNRRTNSFRSDCEAKEKNITLERQSLSERHKALQKEQERLLDAQALMNQREDILANKSLEINRVEEELEVARRNLEKEKRVISDEKSKLQLETASLSQREEALVQKENLLVKREQELLLSEAKLASKTSVEVQKAITNHETLLRTRKSEFEAELEMKRKLVEDEMDARRRAWELREVDLKQREDLVKEREHDLEVKSRMLTDKDKELTEKMTVLNEKERNLRASEKDVESKRALLQKEKEEISKIKSDIQKSFDCMENEKKQFCHAQKKLESMKSETSELSVFEIKLKEEVDFLRAQKLQLIAEEDRLKVEKAKFESEWELIDEKREELQREIELVTKEKEDIAKLLKDEREKIRFEKEGIIHQHKQEVESLNHERREFLRKMAEERSELFNKIQKEHEDFLLGLEMQKRELESSIEKRREEIESYLRDKEKAFELEKSNELEYVSNLKEEAEKELEQVALEMKKLDDERTKINLDREQRDKEWSVLNKSIDELKCQTQKLEQQRELLSAERLEICAQFEQIKTLEDLKIALDSKEVLAMQQSNIESSEKKLLSLRYLKNVNLQDSCQSDKKLDPVNHKDVLDSPHLHKRDDVSVRLSWIKRCTELLFKNSPEKSAIKNRDKTLEDEQGNGGQQLAAKVTCNEEQTLKPIECSDKKESKGYALAEPRVILEAPAESEIPNRTHEIKENGSERITSHVFEHSSQTVRKRSIDSCIDDQDAQEERENSKKAKHEAADGSNNANCVSSTPESDVITDKIVKITEVTCEVTSTEISADQVEPPQLKPHPEALGEFHVHDNAKHEKDDPLSASIQANYAAGKATQLEDDTVQEHDPKVRESSSEKAIETVGMRTRSKQRVQ